MRTSIKAKITLLVSALLLVVSLLLLLAMTYISSAVTTRSAVSQLTSAVKQRATMVSMEEGRLTIEDGFSFYQGGVYILIYSHSEALMAGQPPVQLGAGFENGLVRSLKAGESEYLILDMWLPMGWEDGLWLRGVMERPNTALIGRNLLMTGLIALPWFLLLGAWWAYRIVRRSLVPLDNISAAANAINEASDLSARIGLEGKDEFSRLSVVIDSLFERLERSFEAEKRFIGDASHELRTPVAIIKSACECGAKFDETEEEHRETLAIIGRQADRMSALISQLLSMTRLEQGIEGFSVEPVELEGLIREVCSEQRYQGILLELEPVYATGNPMLLSRLVQNLADNALKYGRPDGRVAISLREQAGEILLTVRDEGEGIAEEEQEKIWQRFYQVDSSRSSEDGAGLGLAMVKKIAEMHGGYMSLVSSEGEGSAFTLHLPKGEDRDEN